jgi:hypothetical protein
MKLHRLSVDAHAGNSPARRNNRLADVEGRWDADGLDGHVHASGIRQRHNTFDCLPV